MTPDSTQDSPSASTSSQSLERPALSPGLEATIEATVLMEWTRAHYESRFPAVFSTPAMIGLMEGASSKAVAPALADGTFTVGTRIEVDHLKAIPVDAPVTVSAKLVEINGRSLIFDVEARSKELIVGRGRITHVVVDLARFQSIASGNKTPATK
jgi:fluoroacetyl-CoA thioesterase